MGQLGGTYSARVFRPVMFQTLPTEYSSYENFNFEIKMGGAHAH